MSKMPLADLKSGLSISFWQLSQQLESAPVNSVADIANGMINLFICYKWLDYMVRIHVPVLALGKPSLQI